MIRILKESFLSDKYLVSDEGFVLSQKGKPLKPSKNPNGYCIVTICVDGKPISVAVRTLIARAFCDGCGRVFEDCMKEEPETVSQIENFGKFANSICMSIAKKFI